MIMPLWAFFDALGSKKLGLKIIQIFDLTFFPIHLQTYDKNTLFLKTKSYKWRNLLNLPFYELMQNIQIFPHEKLKGLES
jgi:hypothetical protein